MPSAARRSRIQSVIPRQNCVPTRMSGTRRTLPVCTSVSASNSSSSVPKPPGIITNAEESFVNITLRAKKCWKVCDMSW